MSEEIEDETGEDVEEEEEGEDAFEVLKQALADIEDNRTRIRKTGKEIAAGGDVNGAKAMLEIAGTVLPLLAEVTKATMDLDDVNDERADERADAFERRLAAIESTLLGVDEAGTYIAQLADLRAFIDNMVANAISQAGPQGPTKDQEGYIAHIRNMADGVIHIQHYLERFVTAGQAEGFGPDEEEDDEDDEDES